jgi:methyl-accepting chemotaxis protein
MPDIGALPHQLLAPLQHQLEHLQEVVEGERRLRRELAGRLFAPVDAVFDALEQSGAVLHQQAQALEEAARALEQAAGLMKAQAELFERTIATAREPAELAKAAAGLDGRRRRAPGN